MNKDNNEIFKTSNLNLATFLVVKNFKLIKILNGSKRKTFVFIDSPKLQKMVWVFNFGEDNDDNLMVDGRKILQTLRDMKTKLYSSLPKEELNVK